MAVLLSILYHYNELEMEKMDKLRPS